jgi:hypothetical protein
MIIYSGFRSSLEWITNLISCRAVKVGGKVFTGGPFVRLSKYVIASSLQYAWHLYIRDMSDDNYLTLPYESLHVKFLTFIFRHEHTRRI